MNDVMQAAWVGVIGVLLGALVASAIEILRTHFGFKREKRWTRWEEKRRYLERVYEAVEQLSESYGSGYTGLLFTLQTGQQAPSSLTAPKAPWAHLRMLVHLYTREFIPLLDKLNKTGPKLGEAMARAVMEPSQYTKSALTSNLSGAYEEFVVSIEEMREAIVRQAQALSEAADRAVGRSPHLLG